MLFMICLGSVSAGNSLENSTDFDWDYEPIYVVGGDCDFNCNENHACNYESIYVVGGDCDFNFDDESDLEFNENYSNSTFVYIGEDQDFDGELDNFDYDLDWDDFDFDDLDEDFDWDDSECDDCDSEESFDYNYTDRCPILLSCCLGDESNNYDFDNHSNNHYSEEKSCDFNLDSEYSSLNDSTCEIAAVNVDTNSTDNGSNMTIVNNQQGIDSQDVNILGLVLMVLVMILSII